MCQYTRGNGKEKAMSRNLCVLGSTGSIGRQTLDVVENHPDDLHVLAMTAGDNVSLLAEQIVQFQPQIVSVKSEQGAEELRQKLQKLQKENDFSMPEIMYGMDGFIACATMQEVGMVVAAMVGMIGLRPVMEAIRHKKDIALANKETLVTAGHIIMPLADEYGVSILPVDSEHSAIFQALQSGSCDEIEQIYLTASGGPFCHYTSEELAHVTVEQALAHPNWNMGHKITVDSATMINKGLEIIEACWLFQVGLEKIHVLVQRESVIHSMVEFQDGSVMAQLGVPDMRIPIQYALMYPARPRLSGERLNFEKMASLSFEAPDTNTLRGIPLAKQAFAIGGSMTTVMNAANEYAVAKFLRKEIGFTDIYGMIEYAMKQHVFIKKPSLDDILETERETYRVLETYQR